jgi:hypothetical protein
METMPRTELDRPGDVRPQGESKMMDLEKVTGMSLESLLYYVLVGEGRVGKEPIGG